MGEPDSRLGPSNSRVCTLNHYILSLKQTELYDPVPERALEEKLTAHQIPQVHLRGTCDYFHWQDWELKWHMSFLGWSVRQQWEYSIPLFVLHSCHSDQQCSRWPSSAWVLEWVNGEFPIHLCWPHSAHRKYTYVFSDRDVRVNMWLQHKLALWLIKCLTYLEWNTPTHTV